MGKFEIFIGKDNQVYFRLRARNGEIICQSEAYTTAHGILTAIRNCKKGIRSLRLNAITATVIDKTKE